MRSNLSSLSRRSSCGGGEASAWAWAWASGAGAGAGAGAGVRCTCATTGTAAAAVAAAAAHDDAWPHALHCWAARGHPLMNCAAVPDPAATADGQSWARPG